MSRAQNIASSMIKNITQVTCNDSCALACRVVSDRDLLHNRLVAIGARKETRCTLAGTSAALLYGQALIRPVQVR